MGSEPLRVLSLFAGIGGIDLGLERAGMRVVAHSEIDPYACKVLAKHWPDVPNLGDVTTLDTAPWIGKVDVIREAVVSLERLERVGRVERVTVRACRELDREIR